MKKDSKNLININEYNTAIAELVEVHDNYICVYDIEKEACISVDRSWSFNKIIIELSEHLNVYIQVFIYSWYYDIPLDDLLMYIEMSLAGRGTLESIEDMVSIVTDKHEFKYLEMNNTEKFIALVEAIDTLIQSIKKANSVDDAVDFFVRYCNDKLTNEEKEEIEAARLENVNKRISDNPYCACGCYQGDETMSIDTH